MKKIVHFCHDNGFTILFSKYRQTIPTRATGFVILKDNKAIYTATPKQKPYMGKKWFICYKDGVFNADNTHEILKHMKEVLCK